MKDAFIRGKADFRGMVSPPPNDNIWINGVFHKAFVDVDEEGTEAAAATAIGATFAAARPQSVFSFVADHPFFFAICYNPTNSLLFLGHVTDPAH
jgi:serpin B